MSATTGPVIAIGAVTMANQSIFNGRPVDWRIPVGTALAAVLFAGAEQLWAGGARVLAWTALAAVCLSRIQPDVPSPAESALRWWTEGEKIARESMR